MNEPLVDQTGSRKAHLSLKETIFSVLGYLEYAGEEAVETLGTRISGKPQMFLLTLLEHPSNHRDDLRGPLSHMPMPKALKPICARRGGVDAAPPFGMDREVAPVGFGSHLRTFEGDGARLQPRPRGFSGP